MRHRCAFSLFWHLVIHCAFMNLEHVLANLLPTAAVLSPAVSILSRDHITTECLCAAVGRSGARMVPTSRGSVQQLRSASSGMYETPKAPAFERLGSRQHLIVEVPPAGEHNHKSRIFLERLRCNIGPSS